MFIFFYTVIVGFINTTEAHDSLQAMLPRKSRFVCSLFDRDSRYNEVLLVTVKPLCSKEPIFTCELRNIYFFTYTGPVFDIRDWDPTNDFNIFSNLNFKILTRYNNITIKHINSLTGIQDRTLTLISTLNNPYMNVSSIKIVLKLLSQQVNLYAQSFTQRHFFCRLLKATHKKVNFNDIITCLRSLLHWYRPLGELIPSNVYKQIETVIKNKRKGTYQLLVNAVRIETEETYKEETKNEQYTVFTNETQQNFMEVHTRVKDKILIQMFYLLNATV